MLRCSVNHHLKDISASYLPELFSYIASYSGIEKLVLQHPDLGDPNIFLHSLLPLHAASLVELSCSASYECRWSFISNAVDGLLKLQKLTPLTMSINEPDIAVPVNAVVRDFLLQPFINSLAGLNNVNRIFSFEQPSRYLRFAASQYVLPTQRVTEARAAEIQ
jgi:hypothetical protein